METLFLPASSFDVNNVFFYVLDPTLFVMNEMEYLKKNTHENDSFNNWAIKLEQPEGENWIFLVSETGPGEGCMVSFVAFVIRIV